MRQLTRIWLTLVALAIGVTITRDDDQLFLQATGQPRFPMFAESQTKFFLKVVEAQITFELDDDGQVTGLVLHQNGQNVPGKRR